MNSGYFPSLFSNAGVNKQSQSQQPPFYFGGSEVPNALGFSPIVKPIKIPPKPKPVVNPPITLNN